MTNAQIQILKTELNTDPGNLGYSNLIAEGNHIDIAIAMNTKHSDWLVDQQYIRLVDMLKFLTTIGARSKIVAAANGAGNYVNAPDSLKSVAIGINDILNGNTTTSIDTHDPQVLGLINALVQAQIISADESTAFLNLAKVTGSRAEVLFGSGFIVNHYDVPAALNS